MRYKIIMMDSCWYVYVVRCVDGSLYAGISTDVDRQVDQHNGNGKAGAKYTQGRRPVCLVYQEKADSRSTATQREIQIKKMSKAAKEKLILDYSRNNGLLT
jgi:putative endonuclease